MLEDVAYIIKPMSFPIPNLRFRQTWPEWGPLPPLREPCRLPKRKKEKMVGGTGSPSKLISCIKPLLPRAE